MHVTLNHNITEIPTLQPVYQLHMLSITACPLYHYIHCHPFIAAIICFPDILSPSLISFSVYVHILSSPLFCYTFIHIQT